MADIVVVSDQWDEDVDGNLLTWVYPDGAAVAAGEVVAEVMVEKLQVEVEAPISGTLRHALAEGDIVRRGAVIGSVGAS